MDSQNAFLCSLATWRFSEEFSKEAAPNWSLPHRCTRVVLGYNTYICALMYRKLFHFRVSFDYRTTFLGTDRIKVERVGGEAGMQDCLCRKEMTRQKVRERAKSWSRRKPVKKREEQKKVNHCSDPASFLCLSSCFALSNNDNLFTLVCEFFKGHQRTGRKKEVKKQEAYACESSWRTDYWSTSNRRMTIFWIGRSNK